MSQHAISASAAAPREENVREVLRLSELYLDNTTKFAIASDARAVTLSTMMATLMTGMAAIGAAIVTLPADHASKLVLFLSVTCIAASFCFMMALVLAAKAAQPQEFDVPGNYIGCFTDADLSGDPTSLLMEQARIYERQITLNNNRLQTSAQLLHTSLAWMKFSPLVAILTGIIAIAVRFPAG